MKVTVNAKKMSQGQMQKISLVRHAANRQPFRILKAEPVPEELDGLASRVKRLFKAEDAPKVTALFVQKSALPALLPTLREAGFEAGPANAELLDEVVVLKQEGYDPDGAGSLMAVTPDLAVGFSTVVKGLATWETSSDFHETLQSHAFFPSIRMATEALMDTIWRINDESDDHAKLREGVNTALDAFAQHVKGLVSALPVNIIKMERALATQFGSPTVAPDKQATTAAKTEGNTAMKNDNLREAVAGDLDGLFDTVTKAEGDAPADTSGAPSPDAEAAPAPEAAEAKKTDEAEGKQDGADENANANANADAPAPADEPVAKADGEADAAPAEPEPELTLQSLAVAMKSAFEKLDETLGSLATSQKEGLEAVNKRLEEVEKSAKETLSKAETAIQKAENTVVTGDVGGPDPLMGTLHTRSTPTTISKNAPQGAGGVFAGLLPDLDALSN